uniref:hypothetical protein n=1 Tax=Chattonella marina TaxID=90936 RepID=UPI002113E44F|nr:hypothetical protein NQZ11_pgp079 [Chattonella marina]UTE94871.1 hypothetical protein CmarPt_p108 [Chattonella marina]
MTKAIRGTPKLVLTSQSGRRFTTSGFKVIKNGDNICGTLFIISACFETATGIMCKPFLKKTVNYWV